MTAIALLTLPLTITSMVLQENAKQEQKNQQQQALDQQRSAAERQATLDQQKNDIALQQEKLASIAAENNLRTQQQATSDALKAYYYKSGIDPTTGSARQALQALSQKNQSDLSLLQQQTNLKKQALSLNDGGFDANSYNAPYTPSYNPLPDAISLLNSFGRNINQL